MKKIFSGALIVFVFFIGMLVVNATNNTLINIDYPIADENLTNELKVRGWIMSEYENPTLEIYVDNKLVEGEISRFARSDVIAAIKDYGSADINPTPGYELLVDLSSYEYGTHTVSVVAKDSTGNTLTEESRKFVKKAPASMINIDYPKVDESLIDELKVRGWIMSEYENPTLEIYVDNKLVEGEISRFARSDVIAAIKDYGSADINPTPGYELLVDLSNYDYGTHTVSVVAKDSTGNTLTEESRKFVKKAPASMINIDYPKIDENLIDELKVRGWIMSEYENPTLEIYVDNKLVEGEISRFARSDVIAAIKDYGSADINPTPGYELLVDLSNYDYGMHTVKIIAKDSTGKTLTTSERKFVKKAPASMINIDYPKIDENLIDELKVRGWIMSEYENPTLEIYVDDKLVEGDISRFSRSDVIAAIKDYGSADTNPTPGYELLVDLSNYEYGTHTVKIIAKDKLGNTLAEESRKFVKAKPNTMITIDNPTSNTNRSLTVSGWVMSETANKTLKVYLDNEEIMTPSLNVVRNDVLNTIKGYGDKTSNPTPGFKETFDLSNYEDGKHTIKVEVIASNNEVIATSSKTFTLEKYKSSINITTPTNSTYKNSIDISGYALSEAPSFSLDLYVDNNLIAENINRTNDANISNSLYEDYGGAALNNLPNYRYTYDVTNLTDGTHTLEVRLKLSTGEVIETKQANFKVKKYESIITVDYPNAKNINRKEDLFIRGWIMSEDKDSTVKIYLDNNEISEDVLRVEREDVLNAINGYGGRETNTLPGYMVTTNISKLSVGYHTLAIKIYDHLNEVINTQNVTLYVYDGFELGIDVSEWNGDISWPTVKNSGGVDFAMIRCGYRGYGTGIMVMDTKFSENFTNAVNNNIKAGIYFFSQAISYAEGAAEANFIIEAINMTPGAKGNIKMPLVLDVETSTDKSGNGRADKITVAQRTDAVKGFIDQMNKYGYKPMIYANKDYLTNKLDLSKWTNYDIWLAHWTYDFNKKSDYTGTYTMWQYTDIGTVNGISGSVDLNVAY